MKSEAICLVASAFVGLREAGENVGPMVEVFQKVTRSPGQPWCLSFIFHCVAVVDRFFPTLPPSALPVTPGCVDLATRMSATLREKPLAGDIALWRMYDRDGNPTGAGHAELVIRLIDSNSFVTVGGNTSDSSGVDREGEGVYEKTRWLKPPAMSRMRLMGFVSPWL